VSVEKINVKMPIATTIIIDLTGFGPEHRLQERYATSLWNLGTLYYAIALIYYYVNIRY